MRVIGALRVKDESRWIQRSIESILPACDEVIVFDDHSTDDTASIAAEIRSVTVLLSPFTGTDEVRDKNYLLGACIEAKADWVVMIDGDEVLKPGHAQRLLSVMGRAMRHPGGCRALAFNVLYLWDREDQIRVDGVYRSMSRVSAFRPGPERFEATGGVNFHCGNCPQSITARSHGGVGLLHYGYLHREDRLRKYRWYQEKDPANKAEDEYRHIVIGDKFPADSKFRHGGPLELGPL